MPIEPVLLALRWLVVGEFMGSTKPGKRWIRALGGRGGWNHHCPGFSRAVFGPRSLKSEYILDILCALTRRWLPAKKYKGWPHITITQPATAKTDPPTRFYGKFWV